MVYLPRFVALLCFLISGFSPIFASAQSTPNFGAGPYAIKPAINSSACMDISGAKPANGTAIQSWSCNGTVAQVWSLARLNLVSGTAYQVVSSVRGSCLDVANVSLANGGLVQEWQCLGASQANQLWRLLPFGSSYELVSVKSGKCLELTGSNSSNGIRLQQWTCSQGTDQSQLWNFVPSASTTAAASTGEQALQADAFVDSIGINTHITYQDTPYWSQWPAILSSLKALGVRHLRDGFYNWSSDSPFYTEHQALAKAGIRTNYVFSINNTTTPQIVQSFVEAAQDMESVEAPNECDAGGNCGGGSLAGINNVAAFMNIMIAVGKGVSMPVLGPSFTTDAAYAAAGQLGSKMTYNNIHLYFGGRNPGSAGWGGGDAEGNNYGSLAWWVDQAHLDAPTAPVMITETGYMTYPQTNVPYTLPESVAASYVPRTLALAFTHGVKRTYLYELLDEVSSPGYGILRSDLSAKPAYTALQSLIKNLGDPGASFAPGKLNYKLTGGDGSLNHLLLQKRDGSFWLVLWLEQSSYNPATNTPTPVAPQGVTLTISGGLGVQQALQMDATGATNALNGGGSTFNLSVTDSMTLIHIK